MQITTNNQQSNLIRKDNLGQSKRQLKPAPPNYKDRRNIDFDFGLLEIVSYSIYRSTNLPRFQVSIINRFHGSVFESLTIHDLFRSHFLFCFHFNHSYFIISVSTNHIVYHKYQSHITEFY